jgi:hypothetical protein
MMENANFVRIIIQKFSSLILIFVEFSKACKNGWKTYDLSEKCDGKSDCSDEVDENQCSKY